MTHPHDELPLRITERFDLPDGRVVVSAWSARDPEQLEQQLRTRVGRADPEREPGRRLHLVRPPLVRIEERIDGVLQPIDPLQRAVVDVRWRTALTRSRRPAGLRRLVGPRDLPTTEPPSDVARWTERRPPGEGPTDEDGGPRSP
ncbi:hypothetical protein EDF22_2859 [Rathayibacter sp. PhB127]|uniref:hypothetical protein n=1 Tax=Rathayibacter sp. PhB127 TaxID=2485176 RepID=UPI000F4C6BB5|nr:hypothetical protein [Rathayibacter sp. PhB127]ROS25644.1 hypothetical protein EDF22_2859 [Rathayibacter sp. PhB127]